MTVRSELKKLVDIDTYEETKTAEGGLDVFVRLADNTGASFNFDPETVSELKQRELAELIVAHLGA